MLNFYTNPLSGPAARVHLFLEEAGRPYKVHVTNLATGEQRTPEFMKLNPMSQVPTIELSGFGMGESVAIMRYLAQKWQMPQFYPDNLEDRARVDQMTDYANIHVARWLGDLAWNLEVAPKFFGTKPDLARAEVQRNNLLQNLNKLESYMQNQHRTYLAGATPTIADFTLAPFAVEHKMAHISLSDFPRIAAWTELMADRPAWKKVAAERAKQMPAKS